MYYTEKKGFSILLSDMCPLVLGITTRDAALSMELGIRAFDLALGGAKLPNEPLEDVQPENQPKNEDDVGILQTGGHLIVKLLESEDTKDGVGSEETPSGGWSVMRLRTAAHGTLGAPRLGSTVGRKGDVGKQVDVVSRQLILTKVSLVERRLDNYEVGIPGETIQCLRDVELKDATRLVAFLAKMTGHR